MTKVAVVTGSNKGIGLAIVRGLCKQFKGDVYLTSRDEGRGKEAVALLQKEGLDPKFHQLDVSDNKSIVALKDFIVSKYGGLDILINNAGIAFSGTDTTPFVEQAEITMKTNYTALLNVSDIMTPILKPGARMVHVSSTVSTMFLEKCSEEKRKKLVATSTIEEVTALMNEFVSDVKAGKHKESGWADWAYGATKIGVTAITPIQQEAIDKLKPGSDIVVNCGCPGFVNTDMSNNKGHLTPDQGAETPLYMALLPPNEKTVRGCFLSKKKVYNWKAGEYSSFS